MRWLSIAFAVALSLVALPAFADLEWADPSLCVNGKWLMINAADNSAIQVQLPEGSVYGDQAEGNCATAATAPVMSASQVMVGGHGHSMTVVIDGGSASQPVTVSYGDKSQTRHNSGHDMHFQFALSH